MSSGCEVCQASFGCMGKPTLCMACKKLLCSNCAGRYVLIPFDSSSPIDSNDINKNGTIESFCKECFERASVLDFSKTYDDFAASIGTGSEETQDVIFIMAHGGGGSRAMFRPYAKELSKRGYRSALLDLPGHGALADTTLSLDACVKAVKDVLDEILASAKKETKFVYVGGSLGGYTGFYVLDKLKDLFSGAIMLDVGQNVGPDASLKARVGLWFMKAMTNQMSNKSMADAMLGVTKKSPADLRLVECTFGAGWFFDQGVAQVECLKAVAPAEYIPNYDFPVFFANGSMDYRDSEEKWLSLCKDEKRSSLKVYDEGDHFFTHDSRFFDDLIGRMDTFAKSV